MVLNLDLYTLAISVGILIVGYVSGRIVENIITKLYEKTISRKAREAGLEEIEEEIGLEKGVRSLMASLLKYIIYTIAILIVLDMVGLTPISEILIEVVKYSPNVIGAIIIIVFGIMIAEIAENITLIIFSEERFGPSIRELQINLSGTVGLAVKYYIYMIALTMALSQLGFAAIPLEILIAVVSLGITAGAVIGGYLLAKDMLPSLSAGEYIKNRMKIKEGDIIKVGDAKGKVVKVGSVYTKISDKNIVCLVPNSHLLKKVVIIKPKKGDVYHE